MERCMQAFFDKIPGFENKKHRFLSQSVLVDIKQA